MAFRSPRFTEAGIITTLLTGNGHKTGSNGSGLLMARLDLFKRSFICLFVFHFSFLAEIGTSLLAFGVT